MLVVNCVDCSKFTSSQHEDCNSCIAFIDGTENKFQPIKKEGNNDQTKSN